jgi:hypothetical protein
MSEINFCAEEHAIQGRLQLCTLLSQTAMIGLRFEMQEVPYPIVAGPNDCLIFAQLG